MKTTIAIIACIFWILFFKSPEGIYFKHAMELIAALGLTILVGYMDYNEEEK